MDITTIRIGRWSLWLEMAPRYYYYFFFFFFFQKTTRTMSGSAANTKRSITITSTSAAAAAAGALSINQFEYGQMEQETKGWMLVKFIFAISLEICGTTNK